ncbi:unnamed protein product [Owenia fusiformis]|uniref:Uncharacterized protein n=1 Tax=Owenia fusiformis TaxID=6347 RepID=A0A8S4NC86_OWEFU|nr:unnamed protein product [Owenia fusiformis]
MEKFIKLNNAPYKSTDINLFGVNIPSRVNTLERQRQSRASTLERQLQRASSRSSRVDLSKLSPKVQHETDKLANDTEVTTSKEVGSNFGPDISQLTDAIVKLTEAVPNDENKIEPKVEPKQKEQRKFPRLNFSASKSKNKNKKIEKSNEVDSKESDSENELDGNNPPKIIVQAPTKPDSPNVITNEKRSVPRSTRRYVNPYKDPSPDHIIPTEDSSPESYSAKAPTITPKTSLRQNTAASDNKTDPIYAKPKTQPATVPFQKTPRIIPQPIKENNPIKTSEPKIKPQTESKPTTKVYNQVPLSKSELPDTNDKHIPNSRKPNSNYEPSLYGKNTNRTDPKPKEKESPIQEVDILYPKRSPISPSNKYPSRQPTNPYATYTSPYSNPGRRPYVMNKSPLNSSPQNPYTNQKSPNSNPNQRVPYSSSSLPYPRQDRNPGGPYTPNRTGTYDKPSVDKPYYDSRKMDSIDSAFPPTDDYTEGSVSEEDDPVFYPREFNANYMGHY